MRLNIEWLAPWKFGTPLKNWVFRVHGATKYDSTKWGIWIFGFYIHWTRNASTNGFGFNIMF